MTILNLINVIKFVHISIMTLHSIKEIDQGTGGGGGAGDPGHAGPASSLASLHDTAGSRNLIELDGTNCTVICVTCWPSQTRTRLISLDRQCVSECLPSVAI